MKVDIGPFPSATSKKDRKVKIKIDNYDLWSLDHTLAMVIYPAVKLIAKHKVGTPMSMFSDRCHELMQMGTQPTAALKREYTKLNKAGHKKWQDTLNEIVWTFHQLAEVEEFEATEGMTRKQEDAYHQRIKDGLHLFAEYYRALWT